MRPGSWKWGQECPQNPQAGKPALRVAQTFLSAGSGDFPVACPSPTFNHTLADCPLRERGEGQGEVSNSALFFSGPPLSRAIEVRRSRTSSIQRLTSNRTKPEAALGGRGSRAGKSSRKASANSGLSCSQSRQLAGSAQVIRELRVSPFSLHSTRNDARCVRASASRGLDRAFVALLGDVQEQSLPGLENGSFR